MYPMSGRLSLQHFLFQAKVRAAYRQALRLASKVPKDTQGEQPPVTSHKSLVTSHMSHAISLMSLVTRHRVGKHRTGGGQSLVARH